jgi:hypothetical protein
MENMQLNSFEPASVLTAGVQWGSMEQNHLPVSPLLPLLLLFSRKKSDTSASSSSSFLPKKE